MRVGTAIAIWAAALSGFSASPRAEQVPEVEEFAEAPDIDDWSYDRLYSSGWRARDLIEVEAKGAEGETVGSVEDLIVDPEGTLIGIVVEAGGVIDIGDQHLFVPWREVDVAADVASVSVPLREDNIEDFELGDVFPLESGKVLGEGDEPKSPWKATNLIDSGVSARGIATYGIVEDLIFGRDAALMAVVVDPDDTFDEGGPYAFPYLDSAYDPLINAYTVPYTPEESARLAPFDYSALEGRVPD